MSQSESKLRINFYDVNDNKLNIFADFDVSSDLSSIFHHVAIFPFVLNLSSLQHSDLIIKPRINPNHSGWRSDSHLTILDAINSLDIDRQAVQHILANSFDCIVIFTRHPPLPCRDDHMENIVSSDDNQSVYTVNTAIPQSTDNHHPINANTLNLPLLNESNMNYLNLPSLNDTLDDDNKNANNESETQKQSATNLESTGQTIAIPPDIQQQQPQPQSHNHQILSRQYIRTQHQLMGRDIVIQCPAVPHNFEIMIKQPHFSNLSKYATSNHVHFNDDDDDENESNNNNKTHKASYYHKVQQINHDKNGQTYDFLNIFPKRIIPQNPQKCTIWTNDTVPSLSSYLLQKKVRRPQPKLHIFTQSITTVLGATASRNR